MIAKSRLGGGVVSLEYILAIIMILNNASVWDTEYEAVKSGVSFGQIILIIWYLALGCLILLSKNIGKLYKKKYVIFSLLAWSYFMIYFIMRHVKPLFSIELFMTIFLLSSYVYLDGKDVIARLLIKYKNLIVFISVMSLFFYVFGTWLNWIEPTGQIYSNWAATENDVAIFKGYMNLHFETQIDDNFIGNGGVVRNSSIFTEAPMFSLHLSLALLVELFIVKRTKSPVVILLIVTIATTTSSTGYALVALALFFKFIIWSKDINKMRYLRAVSLLVLLVFIAGVIIQLFDNKEDTISALTRVDDYIVGIQTWLTSPLFGVGLGNYDAFIQNMDGWRMVRTGYSNSICMLLGQGGIWLFSLYMCAIYIGTIQAYRKKLYNTSCVAFLILYLYCFAIATYKVNILCFLIYIVVNVTYNEDNAY